MRLRRRAVLAAAAAPLAAPRPLRAQDAAWPPGRPIRLVVPFAAAGSSDALGRFLAERLARNLGQPVVVENRPGMAGSIGVEHVARSAPDGTSFVIVTTNQAINETLQPRRGFELLRDLTPVASVNALPLALAVANAVPARSVAELVAHAKANPGRIDYGSSGPGSLYHLTAEEFCRRTGTRMQHIPFRNFNEGRTALVAGQIGAMFDAAFTLAPLIGAGQVRGLATTGARRPGLLPDLPLLSEAVPGMEVTLWNGLLGPAGLPRAMAERMNAEINRILSDPATVEAQARLGAVVTPMTVDAFVEFLRREVAAQAEAVRVAGVQPE
jgi:tripartite-type tricarboxylate transporter receptor subunit TctC